MRRLPRKLLVLAVLLIPAVALGAPNEFDQARTQGWLPAFLSVFLAGVLTSLTPCVYPMIPIVVGIFGAKESKSRLAAFGLASLYVLGMGVMYSSLGVLVALSGRAFGEVLANPWVVIPLVAFYAALAASMFGAFEIALPSGMQARLSQVGGKGWLGAFLMGLVGGLTAAPCTGPILAGILAFVATTRNVPLGFSLLFTYALGMGVLFWIIATFAVSLPKSGRWMDAVKSVAGIALLDMGLYFLRPISPALCRLTSPRLTFLLASLGVAVLGVVVGGIHLTFSGRPFRVGRKAVGVLLLVAGLGGAINWTQTPRHPLPWRHDGAAAIAEAARTGRPMLVDFGAEWCGPCKDFERDVLSDPSVYAEITARFVPLKVDLSRKTPEGNAMKDRWSNHDGILPTIILATPDGQERRRWQGKETPGPNEMLKALREVR